MDTKRLRALRDRTRAMLARWPRLRPFLTQPHLWRWSRRNVCRGAAIGVFFGLMIPVAQIPASVFFSAILRGNLAVAIAGTFITNPLTTAAIYYGMYHFGDWLTAPWAVTLARSAPHDGALERTWDVICSFLVGAPLIATAAAALAYGLLNVLWLAWALHRRPVLWRAARARSQRKHTGAELEPYARKARFWR